MMANWFKTCPQFFMGIVHFLLALLIARYMILKIDSSSGKAERFLVTLRSV